MSVIPTVLLMTNDGIYRSDNAGPYYAASLVGNCILASANGDIRHPAFWYVETDPTTPQIALFNLSSPYASLGDILASKYVRSIQADPMTGAMFFLDTFGGEDRRSIVKKYDISTQSAQEFVLKSGSSVTTLSYALDMKIDAARRRLWVLDAGNGRVLRASLDSGKVDRAFYPENMIAPCSMDIDFTTGTAYFRSLNGIADFTTWSSSSSTENNATAVYHEAIYAATDDGVLALIETESLATYSSMFLEPSASDISYIVDNNLDIPLPLSDSMRIDQSRRNLWWISKDSERIVFMTNIVDMTMKSLSVASSMAMVKGLSINPEDGSAVVCGKIGSHGGVTYIDAACYSYEAAAVYGASMANSVAVASNALGPILPIYCTVETSLEDVSSSSSSNDDLIVVDNIDFAKLAELQDFGSSSSGTSDEWEYPTATTSSPTVDVTVVSMSDTLSSTVAWAIKGGDGLLAPASSVFRTPLFSWGTQSSDPKPGIVAITQAGDLVKAELDLPTATSPSVTTVLQCLSPTNGVVTGLSITDGNSNAYVSGEGILAKVCLDPTVPGITRNEESSSSSSSQSDSMVKPTGTVVLPSEVINDAGVGGLSVQFHSPDDIIYACSEQDGMVYSFSSLSGWPNRTSYGPMPNPFKVVEASRQGGVIVACRHEVSLLSVPWGEKTLLGGFPESDVTDVSVKQGWVSLAVASVDRLGGLVKVLSSDLTTNAALYVTNDEFPSKVCLLTTGKAVVALERNDSGSTKTRLIVVGPGEAASQPSGDIDGEAASIFLDDNFGLVLAVMKSGVVLAISQETSGLISTTVVGGIYGGVSLAAGGIVSSVTKNELPHRMVRIFVGSREGTSDRWDSGSIKTRKNEIMYGGGNNLTPGEAYWVSVSVMNADKKWSAPTVKQFVVPIM